MNARPPEHELWLIKAEHDLKSANILLHADDVVWDTGVYHCQQAAEKSLKAILTSWGEHVPRTHDLTALVEACIAHDDAFIQWRPAAEDLTPSATFFRYPGDLLEPDPEDALAALKSAQELYTFARGYLEPK